MIVLFAGVVQRKGRGLYIIRGGVGCGHTAAVEFVGNVVGDNCPLGIERSSGGEVPCACAGAVGIIVLGAAAVGLGEVAAEGVARSCRHGDGGHRCVVGGGG